MAGTRQAAARQITVDEFAETTMAAFLRALDTRKQPVRPFGPIIFGYIFWPEGTFPGGFDTVGPPGAGGRREAG